MIEFTVDGCTMGDTPSFCSACGAVWQMNRGPEPRACPCCGCGNIRPLSGEEFIGLIKSYMATEGVETMVAPPGSDAEFRSATQDAMANLHRMVSRASEITGGEDE